MTKPGINPAAIFSGCVLALFCWAVIVALVMGALWLIGKIGT